MTDDTHSAQEDLAFLRELVDEDWRPGVWGFGALYVLIGAVLVLHVLISWLADAGLLPLQEGLAYVILYAAFAVPMVWLSRRTRSQLSPRTGLPTSVKGRAGVAALSGAFLAHLTMLVVFVIVAVRERDGSYMEFAPLVLFTSQAAMWFVIHAVRRQGFQLVEAWGWIAATLALAPLTGTAYFGSALGLAAIALMVIPGVHMMRLARKAA